MTKSVVQKMRLHGSHFYSRPIKQSCLNSVDRERLHNEERLLAIPRVKKTFFVSSVCIAV